MKRLPPIMGWSTWNQFKQDISEEAVLGVAKAIRDNGLLAAGYSYINLDDCWQASQRDENKRLSFDIGRFPGKDGIVAKLNELGFKAGIYSSSGSLTCEDMPGSYGYEDLDAQTFAAWGFEYLKYDYCHVVDLPTDPHYKGNNFATEAPPILYIGISSDDGEVVIPACEGEITSPARLREGAVHGLDCPRAACAFTVNMPKAGRYQVAIGYIKKRSHHRQFLLMSVDGVPSAQVWFPPTSGWNSPSRVMAMVDLRAGKNTLTLTNPIRSQRDDSMLRYTRMGDALKKAALLHGRPIFFAVCEHGRTAPWEWAGDVASSWRVSGDISPTWESMIGNYEIAADLYKYQKPGAYNDPDMLEVGIGSLTEEENRSHFILWCMLSAPLILGLDVRTADEKTLALISDPKLIAINQDPLLQQATRTKLADDLDLLIKSLINGRFAVCLFNKSDKEITNVTLPSWAEVGAGLNIPVIAPHGVSLHFLGSLER
ncbi:MAG: alpha-galactosidase [Defluviitaleaceae bacterium]|nr:alpha-galactosidase [Defluviitaleaceae bacterium]